MFGEEQDELVDGVRGSNSGGGEKTQKQQEALHHSLSYWLELYHLSCQEVFLINSQLFKMWQEFVDESAMNFKSFFEILTHDDHSCYAITQMAKKHSKYQFATSVFLIHGVLKFVDFNDDFLPLMTMFSRWKQKISNKNHLQFIKKSSVWLKSK